MANPAPKTFQIRTKIITHRSSKDVIYVGIDVHKKFLQVAAVERNGTLLLNERVDADHTSVRRFFLQFPKLFAQMLDVVAMRVMVLDKGYDDAEPIHKMIRDENVISVIPVRDRSCLTGTTKGRYRKSDEKGV